MVPLLGLTEGPEKDVVMNDIGGIPGLGVEPVEEGKGTVPRGRLVFEDESDLFGGECGREGV